MFKKLLFNTDSAPKKDKDSWKRIIVFSGIFLSFFHNFIILLLPNNQGANVYAESTSEIINLFINGVIVAPFVETIIFYSILQNIFSIIIKNKLVLSLLISILFFCFHISQGMGGWGYFIFILGLLMSWLFILQENKKTLSVFLFHSCFNLVAMLAGILRVIVFGY